MLPRIDRCHNDSPKLATDANGRVWLFGRHRTIRQRDMPDDTPLHRAAWQIWTSTLDGGRWTVPFEFPSSAGRQDVRWGVASDGAGGLVAAWQSDGRDFSEFLHQHTDVFAAKLPKFARNLRDPQLRLRPERRVLFHDVAPTEAEDLERLRNYEITSAGRTYKIYRGDTHRHTEFSMDGNNDGSLFQTYRYALDAASLDYLLVSEHNFRGGPDIDYINWVLQQAVDVFSVTDRFQPFYGYERSIRSWRSSKATASPRSTKAPPPLAAHRERPTTQAGGFRPAGYVWKRAISLAFRQLQITSRRITRTLARSPRTSPAKACWTR